jgi:hypothetical protein
MVGVAETAQARTTAGAITAAGGSGDAAEVTAVATGAAEEMAADRLLTAPVTVAGRAVQAEETTAVAAEEITAVAVEATGATNPAGATAETEAMTGPEEATAGIGVMTTPDEAAARVGEGAAVEAAAGVAEVRLAGSHGRHASGMSFAKATRKCRGVWANVCLNRQRRRPPREWRRPPRRRG